MGASTRSGRPHAIDQTAYRAFARTKAMAISQLLLSRPQPSLERRPIYVRHATTSVRYGTEIGRRENWLHLAVAATRLAVHRTHPFNT